MQFEVVLIIVMIIIRVINDHDDHDDHNDDDEDDNDEPLKKGCVSLKNEWSTDSCLRRSLMMMAMVMKMFLRMLLGRTIMMNL